MALTNIEMQYMHAQIEQTRLVREQLPKIAAALEAIAAHVETIAVTAEALLDDNFSTEEENLAESLREFKEMLKYATEHKQNTTVDEHFESVIEMQTGITEDGVGRE